MIDHDNLIEYADPVLYDLETHEFEPAGPFYLSLAQQVSGSVLELGCGTGRYTIPLAEQGIDITGLDVVPGMLARGKEKAGTLPIHWVEADARDFHLGRKFDLILVTGSMFAHLLSRADQEAALACIREHLMDTGYFVTDLLFPNQYLLSNVEEEEDWFTVESKKGQQVRVSGTQHYDPLNQIRIETAYRRWQDETGQEIERVAPLAQRLIFPQEAEMLFQYNGFEITERYGNWDRNPLTGESRTMIYICQKTE